MLFRSYATKARPSFSGLARAAGSPAPVRNFPGADSQCRSQFLFRSTAACSRLPLSCVCESDRNSYVNPFPGDASPWNDLRRSMRAPGYGVTADVPPARNPGPSSRRTNPPVLDPLHALRSPTRFRTTHHCEHCPSAARAGSGINSANC